MFDINNHFHINIGQIMSYPKVSHTVIKERHLDDVVKITLEFKPYEYAFSVKDISADIPLFQSVRHEPCGLVVGGHRGICATPDEPFSFKPFFVPKRKRSSEKIVIDLYKKVSDKGEITITTQVQFEWFKFLKVIVRTIDTTTIKV